MTQRRAVTGLVLGLSAALLLAACGDASEEDPAAPDTGDDTATEDTDSGDSSGEEVTLTWWHNSNNDPGKTVYEEVAAEFEAANEGVTIEISALAHEDMRSEERRVGKES